MKTFIVMSLAFGIGLALAFQTDEPLRSIEAGQIQSSQYYAALVAWLVVAFLATFKASEKGFKSWVVGDIVINAAIIFAVSYPLDGVLSALFISFMLIYVAVPLGRMNGLLNQKP